MVAFNQATHQKTTLKAAPWFMFRQFVFAATWNLDFDVHKDFKMKVPIQVELPFRALILEKSCCKVIAVLGPILHFLQGRTSSHTPMIELASQEIQPNALQNGSKYGLTQSTSFGKRYCSRTFLQTSAFVNPSHTWCLIAKTTHLIINSNISNNPKQMDLVI